MNDKKKLDYYENRKCIAIINYLRGLKNYINKYII